MTRSALLGVLLGCLPLLAKDSAEWTFRGPPGCPTLPAPSTWVAVYGFGRDSAGNDRLEQDSFVGNLHDVRLIFGDSGKVEVRPNAYTVNGDGSTWSDLMERSSSFGWYSCRGNRLRVHTEAPDDMSTGWSRYWIRDGYLEEALFNLRFVPDSVHEAAWKAHPWSKARNGFDPKEVRNGPPRKAKSHGP